MLKNSKLKTAIAVSVVGLGLIAFPGIALAAQDTGITTVNVNVGSQITLTNGSTTVNINPVLGTTGSAVQALSVTTNNTTGYQLTIEMNSLNRSLMNGANAITASTNPVSPTPTPGALQNDTWGFNYGTTSTAATTFMGIPAQGSPFTIATSNVTANNVATYVTFGALPTVSLPSGTYTGSVLYTAVTNP